MKYTFTKKAFHAWLKSKKNRVLVGQPENRRYCPLCEFLKSQEGVNKVDMGFLHKIVNERGSVNPTWAVRFQLAATDFVKNDESRSITAKRALSFL